MSKHNNGGPAFPSAPEADKIYNRINSGMTLRDYFAAKAMPALYRDFWDDFRSGVNCRVPEDWKMGIAIDSYAMADAMLKAREGGE